MKIKNHLNSTMKLFKKPTFQFTTTKTQNRAKFAMFHKNKTQFTNYIVSLYILFNIVKCSKWNMFFRFKKVDRFCKVQK
jgi:hypothetical protein